MKHFSKTKLFFTACIFLVFSQLQSQENQNTTSAAQDLQNYINQYNKFLKENPQKSTIKRDASIISEMPLGVNPFLSLHSDRGSYKEWSDYMYKKAQELNQTRSSKAEPVSYIENEIEDEGSNDSPNTAEQIPNFGSGNSQNDRVLIKGALLGSDNPEFEEKQIEVIEDDGSLSLANAIVFDNPFQKISASGAFGNGPHGSGGTQAGDSDFYAVSLKEGEFIEFNGSRINDSGVNPVTVLFNSSGQIITFDVAPTPVTSLSYVAPSDGIYYFGVYDFNMLILTNPATINPLDSGSGNGIGLEGDYAVSFSFFGLTEIDYYTFQLEKGDVFGVAVDARSNTSARLILPDGQLGAGTTGFLNFPLEESPLPTNGETSFAYIAPEKGLYKLSIGSSYGPYDAEILATRPGTEINKGTKQIIYLDFTGATITQREFFEVPDTVINPDLDIERVLSPLADFMENWGIENTQLNRYILTKQIGKVVEENLKRDFQTSGINPNFDIEIISDFGLDFLGDVIPKFLEYAKVPYGKMIVGGTIEESGIGTIGIAQSIDTGNFRLTDEALVLLDLLSDVDPNSPISLNNIPLADGVVINDLIATALGNVIAHEAGHYLGNFHTSTENDVFSIMDEGGRIESLFGTLSGEPFGGPNTVDVDFVTDIYSLREGFDQNGRDMTEVNTAFGLSFFPYFYYGKESLQFEIEDLKTIQDKEIAKLYEIFNTDVYSYPNPQQKDETSRLLFTSEKAGNVNVVLYDIQGREVEQLFNGKINAGETKEIQLNPGHLNLKSGIYIYNVKTPQREVNHRIVIK